MKQTTKNDAAKKKLKFSVKKIVLLNFLIISYKFIIPLYIKMEFLFRADHIRCTESFEYIQFECNDTQNMMFQMLSEITKLNQDRSVIKVNVLQVCRNAAQLLYFKNAQIKLADMYPNIYSKMKFDFKINDDIRKDNWITGNQLILWIGC